ncbi:N-6 DNA methylase [Campylobacter upsaliensis]|nr:restriction endonuclease [Campylobacter upsaliensis]EIR8269939.1 N-6 DNA methylase [Campylobacter upsaliensis]EKA2509453.1 N-6 DNA methylase [Campylobacter upsaliensis]
MITKDNLKEVLELLNFKPDSRGDTWSKSVNSYHLQVDFTNQKLIYPQDLYTESDSVTSFTTTDGKARNENFVVFECVHRLLEQGYKAEDLVLEKTWKLGHTGKSGRADITIYKEAKDSKEKFIYAIIECKTAGKKYDKDSEYSKAKKDLFTNEEGNQLFSYAAQARSVEWLMLYASDFDENTKSITYKDEIIKFKDDDNVLDLALNDPSIETFKQASETSDIFSAWEDTYNKQSYHDLIFKSQAYNIGILPLYKKDLKPFDESKGLSLKFREILRHNKVSNRNTAFDVLLAVFLAKCYDEKKDDDERLEFYYNPFSDDYFSLYKRLKKLFISAMIEFLNEEVFFIADDLVEKTFKDYFHTNRKQAQKILEDAISNAQNYSAQFFAFKKVYNKKLFNQNGKILVEVIQLFENYRIVYANKNQFLSDLFEHFLNEGFTQNEGIYFTPTPITRFIWNSLPFESFINLRHKTFPKVLDFACGAGHFLTEGVSAMSDYCKDTHLSIEDREISRYFYGIDADDRLAMTSQVSMLLNGAGDNKIRFIDGLEYDKEFYGEKQQDFDILVANPPYSVKEFKQHLSRSVLKGKNGNIPYKVLEYLSPNAKEIELVFIERLIHILKPNALCAIVLPSSILSNTDKATILARELILQNFAIHAICSFGSQTFGTTGTNTAVLFLRRFDEPPKITHLLEDSLNAIFDNQSLENFADLKLLESYVALQNIELESYKAFLKQEQIPSHELFKEYELAFNEQKEIKNYKESKGFKDLDKQTQKQELEKRLFAFIVELEREKLKYFALTYKQNTLIIKAPDDVAQQKRFLGFVINKSKTSNAGLQETEGLLSDEHNRNATDKIAFCVKQSFKGEFHTHEAFSKYVSFTQTCKLLNYENVVFNKAISLNPINSQGEGKTQNPFENCKFELVKISEVCNLNKFKNQISKNEIQAMNLNFGSVKLLPSSKNYDWWTDEKTAGDYINEGEVIALGVARYANIKKHKGKFVSSNNKLISIKDNTDVLFDYIYILLEMYGQNLYKQGSQYPQFDEKKFDSFKIPKPDIKIQKQIVSECEKVEEQYNTIRMSIEKYQELIKAILVKCGIIATDEFIGGGGATSRLIASLLDSIQELESKLDFNNNNILDFKALFASLPTPPPQGWDTIKLNNKKYLTLNPSKREIANIDENTIISFVEMASVADKGYIQNKVDKPLKELKKGSYTYFAENDILIAKITPCMENGKCAIAKNLTNGLGMGSSEFHIFRTYKGLNNKFLFACLNQDSIRQEAAKNMTGSSGHRRVPISFYESLQIPLPPLEAQEKIVYIIESVENEITKLKEQSKTFESKKAEILKSFLKS